MVTTTAIYQNRIDDKNILESITNLSEFGNNTTKFIIPSGPILAIGYERIVYGDHGPYIEFIKHNFQVELISKFGNKLDTLPDPEKCQIYYFWLQPVNIPKIKIYWQIKTVKNRPNAPARTDGKPSTFGRVEGYADYKIGFYYVNPYDLKIEL